MVAGLGLAATPAHAQDYRARVQGRIVDTSQAALPGVTVTLTNVATGVAVDRVSDGEGRYLFDFVEPGIVHHHRRAPGLQEDGAGERPRPAARRRHRRHHDVDRPHRGVRDGRADRGDRRPVQLQQHRADVERAADRSGADRRPQPVQPGGARSRPCWSRRRPTRTGPTTTPTPTTTTPAAAPAAPTTCCSTACRSAPATRRPTRRRWTRSRRSPISKNSVDAENGNSLGGIISLNMKSGTNSYHGSGYAYFRDPSHERPHRPDAR